MIIVSNLYYHLPVHNYTVVVGEVKKSFWTIRSKKINVEFFIRMFIFVSIVG